VKEGVAREGPSDPGVRARRGRIVAPAALALAAAILVSCASSEAPRLALEYYELGNAWLQMEKWDKAGAAYEKALSYDRSLVAASYNLARALTEAGLYPRALEAVDRLLAEDPDNVRLLTLKAYTLHKAGDDDAALAAYRRASVLNPRDAPTLRNLAFLLEKTGEYKEARGILRELHAVDPSDDAVLRRLALLETRLLREYSAGTGLGADGSGDDAETLLSASLARDPRDRELLRARAELREERELFALALEDWAALVKEDAADGEAWFRLARIRLVVAGDREAGLEALRRALDAKFSDPKAARALLTALPEAERAVPAGMLKAAGLTE